MSDIYIIAGGDMRFAALAEEFGKKHEVYLTGFDKLTSDLKGCVCTEKPCRLSIKADKLILPLPVTADGVMLNAPFSEEKIFLEELLPLVSEKTMVFGGRAGDEVKKLFAGKGIGITDYFEREELTVLNALATAEGAVRIALDEPYMLSGSKILILGMGRIAKALIRVLSGFGADLTAAARKSSDRAWAEVMGCKSADISALSESGALAEADIIFNTVPALILDRKLLCECRRAFIIDLASAPGGVDKAAAAELGVRTVHALSLPGKASPVSAGRIIGRTIENILNEKEV